MLCACLSVVFTLYIDCILAIYLDTQYGVPNNMIGIYFLMSSISYVIGAPLTSWLTSIYNRRYIVFTAFILMTIQSAFYGPSELLDLPQSLAFITIGISMCGLCLAMGLVPLLSEIIEILEEDDMYDPV